MRRYLVPPGHGAGPHEGGSAGLELPRHRGGPGHAAGPPSRSEAPLPLPSSMVSRLSLASLYRWVTVSVLLRKVEMEPPRLPSAPGMPPAPLCVLTCEDEEIYRGRKKTVTLIYLVDNPNIPCHPPGNNILFTEKPNFYSRPSTLSDDWPQTYFKA